MNLQLRYKKQKLSVFSGEYTLFEYFDIALDRRLPLGLSVVHGL